MCMAILARALSVAFLICDDNIGGAPAAYPPLRSWEAVFAPAPAPDHLVTMRLGREHYRDGPWTVHPNKNPLNKVYTWLLRSSHFLELSYF